MTDFDLVVRGGRVAAPGGVMDCDVGVKDGRIAVLGAGLRPGAKEIDAEGKLVLPGGVDSHCHIEQPEPVGENPDTFETATRSAACGGTTTVICFADQAEAGSMSESVALYHEKARRSVVDYAFHLLVRRVTDKIINEELPRLIGEGNRSLKYFMASATPFTDRDALELMATAREHGALVLVHAENQDAIGWCTDRLVAAGRTAPADQPTSRPIAAEREATQRAIALAEIAGVPLQVFHVSAGEVADEIRRARERGLRVYGETHPHYLLLTAEDADRPGFEGAKFLCSPPLRSAGDNDALWAHLRQGVLQTVTSDHSPFNFCGPGGKQLHGTDAPFHRIPNGLPAVETRLPLLFSEGVAKGRIDLDTFVALAATNAAKLFGLYPRKGVIAVGADADLVVWDAEKRVTVTNGLLHHNVDYTPFEGWEVEGWPITTICRGEVLWHEGEVLGRPGFGRYLPRDPYEAIEPIGRTPFSPEPRPQVGGGRRLKG